MARKSVTAKAGKTGRKAKAAGKRAKAAAPAVADDHPEDHIDGCELEFRESDATSDAALPAAKGGVEALQAKGKRGAMRWS